MSCATSGATAPALTGTASFDAGATTASAVLGVEYPPQREVLRQIAAESGDTVLASYYGPGLWGNRTACGQVLTSELLGVAHRTLPCGALVTLRFGARSVTVPVVDRGPFNLHRELDLTYATKSALGCPDLCRLDLLK